MDTLSGNNPRSPISVEALFTKQAISYQLIFDKKFSGQDQFGFFSVVNLLNRYDNDKNKNEFMALTMVTYQIFRRLYFDAGMWTNNTIGFMPTVALHYSFVNKNFLFVYVPRVDLRRNHNLENVLIFEYFPKLSKNWGLYNRFQGLYNHNIAEHTHDRSYVYLRLGANFKKYRFGIGSNIDYYGPERIQHVSMGLFVGSQLF